MQRQLPIALALIGSFSLATLPAFAEKAERDCLPMSQIDRIEIVDDQTLMFHMHGDRKYINRLPYPCHGLKSEGTFLHETSLNSYCDLDIISVLDTSIGMRLGSCPLGDFELHEGNED